ncbi:hypothetical protein 7F15_61 [uncultured Caudovirales phage]|uniref:Uncharacterized protein n=1 Tax=uncultured Caudovirales phage TaxID=2100421 RepID=A0A2H4J2V0_9CAUD|nr:hypothetical protein 7F15_61 [uncultured Caudovirales phage]
MNNRQSKIKSNDAINVWSYAEFGGKYKKKEKRNINRKRRAVLKNDLLSIRKDIE